MDYLHDTHPSELEDIFSSARLVGAETTTDLLYREIRRHMNPVVVDIDTVAEVNGEWICEPASAWYPKVPCHLCRACQKVVLHYEECEDCP